MCTTRVKIIPSSYKIRTDNCMSLLFVLKFSLTLKTQVLFIQSFRELAANKSSYIKNPLGTMKVPNFKNPLQICPGILKCFWTIYILTCLCTELIHDSWSLMLKYELSARAANSLVQSPSGTLDNMSNFEGFLHPLQLRFKDILNKYLYNVCV